MRRGVAKELVSPELGPHHLACRERVDPPAGRDRFDDAETPPALAVQPSGDGGDGRVGVFDLDPERCVRSKIPHPEFASVLGVSHHVRDEFVGGEEDVGGGEIISTAEQLAEDVTTRCTTARSSWLISCRTTSSPGSLRPVIVV